MPSNKLKPNQLVITVANNKETTDYLNTLLEDGYWIEKMVPTNDWVLVYLLLRPHNPTHYNPDDDYVEDYVVSEEESSSDWDMKPTMRPT
jgi:hypothetical protein